MADKLPFEEPLRRAVDANMKYYEALGRITQEYWKAIFGIWRELPVRFGPSQPSAAPAAAPQPNPTASTTALTLVLEAAAGEEAQGVFLVENRLTRVVSTAVVVSAFADPSGRAFQPTLRVEPGVITLPPGGRTLVNIYAAIDDTLETDVPYRGEVNVPGLSESGIPVLLRRTAGGKAAGTKESAQVSGRTRGSGAKKSAGRGSKSSAKRSSAPKRKG